MSVYKDFSEAAFINNSTANLLPSKKKKRTASTERLHSVECGTADPRAFELTVHPPPGTGGTWCRFAAHALTQEF